MPPRDEIPAPPEPPEVTRPRITGRQWISLAILLTIPLLALFGVFGIRSGHAVARSAELELRVTWPSRTRHEMIHQIEAVVTNRSARSIDTVTVEFDRDYLDGFVDRSITPSAVSPWVVALVNVQPGEERLVILDVDALRSGTHSGPVLATTRGGDTARVTIETIILP